MKNFQSVTAGAFLLAFLMVQGCIDPIPGHAEGDVDDAGDSAPPLSEIAGLLSELPLEYEHIKEIHNAVSASSANGYDEEYTMANLFTEPGSGVGDSQLGKKSASGYVNPVSALIRSHLLSKMETRSTGISGVSVGSEEDVDAYIEALASSDIQIYWPFSENWQGGDEIPIITFDPEDESSTNTGYRIRRTGTGENTVETVVVDEKMASETPVWVINRNSDSTLR